MWHDSHKTSDYSAPQSCVNVNEKDLGRARRSSMGHSAKTLRTTWITKPAQVVSHRGTSSIGSMLRYALHNPQSASVANRDNPPMMPPTNTARALIGVPLHCAIPPVKAAAERPQPAIATIPTVNSRPLP